MSSLEVDRERVIQALCAHYANDALTTQELEARFAIAHRARSEVDLQAVLVDLPPLPALSPPVPVRAPHPALPPFPTNALRPADAIAGGAAMVAHREKRILAFMAETKKAGEWVPGRRNVVRAIMGTVHIDLREALLSQGEVEFDVSAVMGEVRFTVPPGLRVECEARPSWVSSRNCTWQARTTRPRRSCASMERRSWAR